MSIIEMKNFMGSASCNYVMYSCNDSFPISNFTLYTGNVYGIISDFCNGSWALSECIGGFSDDCQGEVLINGTKSIFKNIQYESCHIPESDYEKDINMGNEFSVKNFLERLKKDGKLILEPEEYKRIFGISDERYDRSIKKVSGEIWRISFLINFLLNKNIFCLPWIGEREKNRILCCKNIFEFLRSNNKLILLPTNQDKVFNDICDKFIVYKNYHFTNL